MRRNFTYWTSGTYTYDGSGNIREIGADWYVYDRLGRLVEGTSESGAKQQNLTIDPYGNITGNTTRVGSIDADRTMVVSTATNRLTTGGTEFGTYDQWGGGNLVTHNGIWTYGYDCMGMVRRVTGGGKDFAYVYTADEQRLWELDPSLSRGEYSLRNLDGKTLRVFKENSFANPIWTSKQDYVHRGSTLHSGSLPSGIIHYHADHLGTPRYVTNASRAQFGRHAYYPFGEESTAQSQNTEEAKFTGHERDTNFQDWDRSYLDYMHARYYSPVMGRFLSVDPKGSSAKTHQPQTWNRYSYSWNSPINCVDPDGREPNKTQAGSSAGFVAMVQEIERGNPRHTPGQVLKIAAAEIARNADAPGNTRYVYTTEAGWIDQKHFFAAAQSATVRGQALTNIFGIGLEISQIGTASSFSYEDTGSNAAGAEFGAKVLYPDGSPLSSQVQTYLKSLGVTDPLNAPNYKQMPENMNTGGSSGGPGQSNQKVRTTDIPCTGRAETPCPN